MDADLLIAGAGCAGLSLAVHVLERGPRDARLLLLEPRKRYTRDRTWCFWRTRQHPFERAVTHRWTRWRVCNTGRTLVKGSARYPYEHLPADAFYAEALHRLAISGRAELVHGVRVERLEDRGRHVVAHTSGGEVHARLAFDSRPSRGALLDGDREINLMQHFVGWFVRAQRPVFDADVATLMDFTVDQRDGVHFIYILPFDAHHALVEDTYFSAHPFDDRFVYEDALQARLEALAGPGEYAITGTERGVLPMSTAPVPRQRARRVYRIGLTGGLAKPSSGYAFLFIQRHSAALAERLTRASVPPPPPARSSRAYALDRIFLSWLAHHPKDAPRVFFELFERAPTEPLVRFLSETSSPLDDARVMTALPARALTLEALRFRRLWMRRRDRYHVHGRSLRARRVRSVPRK